MSNGLPVNRPGDAIFADHLALEFRLIDQKVRYDRLLLLGPAILVQELRHAGFNGCQIFEPIQVLLPAVVGLTQHIVQLAIGGPLREKCDGERRDDGKEDWLDHRVSARGDDDRIWLKPAADGEYRQQPAKCLALAAGAWLQLVKRVARTARYQSRYHLASARCGPSEPFVENWHRPLFVPVVSE